MQMDRMVSKFRSLAVWRLKWRRGQSGVSLSFLAIILAGCINLISPAQAQITGALSVSSPANDTRVDGRMVTIQFEVASGISANGIPAFRVQLDRQSPVLITDTEYDLFCLSPGWHTVTINLVDANGTPMFGAQTQVQFEVIADNESAALEPFFLSMAADTVLEQTIYF
jgi:hypothetical protein